MSTEQARRIHVLRILAKRNGYQWGQPPATTTLVKGGSVACGDASVQLVARIWTGRRYSLDAIRRLSRAPHDQPTSAADLVTALHRLGLDYLVVTGYSASRLARIARERGPVIALESYSHHPEWFGYRYGLTKADGQPNGYSRPRGASGKTQLSGFTGGHWFVIATSRRVERRVLCDIRDPNHASRLRPERPAWDRLSLSQLDAMLDSRKAVTGYATAIIPSRRLEVPA